MSAVSFSKTKLLPAFLTGNSISKLDLHKSEHGGRSVTMYSPTQLIKARIGKNVEKLSKDLAISWAILPANSEVKDSQAYEGYLIHVVNSGELIESISTEDLLG